MPLNTQGGTFTPLQLHAPPSSFHMDERGFQPERFFMFLYVPAMIVDEMVLDRLTALLAVIALCYAIKVMSKNIIIIHEFYQSYFYLEAPLHFGITVPMMPWGM